MNSSAAAVDIKMQLLLSGAQRNVFLSYVMSFKLERSANLCCTSSNAVVTDDMRLLHRIVTSSTYQ